MFTEWFNPECDDHIDAYIVYIETDEWPEGFIPSDVTFEEDWNVILWAKMAAMWVYKQRETRNEMDF